MAHSKEAVAKTAAKKKETHKKSGKHAGAPRKPNVFVRLRNYFQGVGAELKRVVWPSRKEVVNSTIIVIVTLIFFGLFTFAVDWLATNGIESLLKLK
jgi:preprotein translocase subunit SecE